MLKSKFTKKRVQVTWSDIKQSQCGEPLTCAVAKALNRQHKQRGWFVNCAAEIKSPYHVIYSVVSKDVSKVEKFISDFDDGVKVKPIAFDIVRVVEDVEDVEW